MHLCHWIMGQDLRMSTASLFVAVCVYVCVSVCLQLRKATHIQAERAHTIFSVVSRQSAKTIRHLMSHGNSWHPKLATFLPCKVAYWS